LFLGKRKVNPCWSKGRDLGRNGQGKLGAGSGCECKYKAEFFAPKAKDDSARSISATHTASYSYLEKNSRLQIIEEQTLDAPQTGLSIQPCHKAFLEKSSMATKLFLKHNPKSAFTGCSDVENDLIKNGLINNTPFDGGRGHQTFATEEFFEGQVMAAQAGVESVFIYKGTLRDISCPHPVNLRQSVLRKLMHDMNTFLVDDGKVLYLTAVIIDRGLNTKDHEYLIEDLFPYYPKDDFKKYEAKISLMVARELKKMNEQTNNRYSRLEKVWKKITEKQENVVLALFCNEDELTVKEIASKFKIKESSVRDRLKNAKIKMKKAFPELVPLTEQVKSYTRAELERREYQYDGMYRLSNAEKLHPCTITNEKTKEVTVVTRNRLVLNEDYDPALKKRVREWINKVAPNIQTEAEKRRALSGKRSSSQNEEP
ncbi:MAG: sigma-70 family RNA polymerase sigma factor, partial [Bdellovibrionaceae bacterium]|nr:sigma-70 family RNA polymerase sigma factor [Pseudobdellovibrionaceae bacterium]